ncbi:MAG: hypothetical protein U9P14_11270, partial [Gemmatimonadota bacterium]|nr:hypothetical protein [Gemmatimonadota bacterium]
GQAGEWTDPSRLAYLSSSQVVAFARKAVLDRDPVGFEQDPLIETLRYFADCYLVSPRWQVSNNGVKLVGILQYHQRRGLLLAMAGDRSRAPFLKRLIGGDFRQVGFIRRNALLALAGLGEWDENLRDLLLLVLNNDPYYESRTAAAEVIIQLREKIGSSQALTQAIEANLRHRSLEVRCRALEALGAVTDDPELMPGTNLESFLFHPNWRIRQALARAARHMLERGLVQPSDPLVRQLENIIPTCTDFVPTYPLKHSLNRLRSFSSDDCDCTGPSDGKGPT